MSAAQRPTMTMANAKKKKKNVRTATSLPGAKCQKSSTGEHLGRSVARAWLGPGCTLMHAHSWVGAYSCSCAQPAAELERASHAPTCRRNAQDAARPALTPCESTLLTISLCLCRAFAAAPCAPCGLLCVRPRPATRPCRNWLQKVDRLGHGSFGEVRPVLRAVPCALWAQTNVDQT